MAAHEFTIINDPLATPSQGTKFTCSSLNISPVQAEAAPLTVENYEYFDGTLLAVCIGYGDTYRAEGTAVMIGLGLALSAKHVVDDHRKALAAGEAVVLCMGVRGDGTVACWHCYSMEGVPSGSDLTLLSLRLVSDMPADGDFATIPLTTRIPAPGERLTIVGFRFDDEPVDADWVHDRVPLIGSMYVSQGAAGQFSYPIHDSVLAPYPTIEVLSGTLGGMSGGAVIGVNGHVVGITSRGLSHDDQKGPSLAAWWLPALFWTPALSWPTGMHDGPSAVSQNVTVRVVGREYLEITEDGRFNLTHWT
jgi:hypothetical protein